MRRFGFRSAHYKLVGIHVHQDVNLMLFWFKEKFTVPIKMLIKFFLFKEKSMAPIEMLLSSSVRLLRGDCE